MENLQDMDVEPKIGGKPPKWMVKIMENPTKMDDLGGKNPIFGNTHMGSVGWLDLLVGWSILESTGHWGSRVGW